MGDTVVLGDVPLSFEEVEHVARGAKVQLSATGNKKIKAARALIEEKARQDKPVYGVTTGFGALAEVKVSPEQLGDLQRNLILSHAAGVGRPLSRPETRAMMLLRAQALAQGHSGVRPEIMDMLTTMLNRGVHPVVPEKGSVGASGDLAPLAHLALGMLGEGEVELEGSVVPAADALAQLNIKPVVLQAKEGLALVNGTQAMTAVGLLALLRAERLSKLADIAGAMTLEGLKGINAAFDERINLVRPHQGQLQVASNIRKLFAGSEVVGPGSATKVQDPYSLRCMPQVHGATRDALAHARVTLTTELNSATDNPLVFPEDGDVLSGGNFHGQPVALALDFAAMGIAELGNISERRVEQLVNPALSGLPPFLVKESGTHSGYMMAQVTAASLVNENKILANPACTDSISGSASREDHVSMGMTSARKLREIVENLRAILAVEVLCAAQAMDFHQGAQFGAGTRAAHKVVREAVPHLDGDRLLSKDIARILQLDDDNAIVEAVENAVGTL